MQLLFQFKMTPLHLAAEKGNLQAVKKLVENASCPAKLGAQNQVTFCLFAKSNNRKRVIDIFSLFVLSLRDIFKGIFLLSSRNLCVHKARAEREISWRVFSRESSRDLLWENKMRKLKDGAYYCYCAYVLRISRYSDFLSPMLTNTGIFLRGLKLSGESRS